MGYDRAAVEGVLAQALAEGRSSLSAGEAKQVCDAYQIATPGEGLATSPDDAVALAERLGYPVVLKIVSPDILHKTEAGGVLVGLSDPAGVAQGYGKIVANAQAYKADPRLETPSSYVEDTGEVNWLISDALCMEVLVPVIAQSVMQLFVSRDAQKLGLEN